MQTNTAVIYGTEKLMGARVSAPDLRAGAALVIAGLAAEGITIVVERLSSIDFYWHTLSVKGVY